MEMDTQMALAAQAQSISELQAKVDHLLRELRAHDRRIDGLAAATGTGEADHQIEREVREQGENTGIVPPYLQHPEE